jgi:hypothetical protein
MMKPSCRRCAASDARSAAGALLGASLEQCVQSVNQNFANGVAAVPRIQALRYRASGEGKLLDDAAFADHVANAPVWAISDLVRFQSRIVVVLAREKPAEMAPLGFRLCTKRWRKIIMRREPNSVQCVVCASHKESVTFG